MRSSLKETLMTRDKISEEEALEIIDLARKELDEMLENGDNIDDGEFMQEHFGLEPDWIDELFDF